MSTDKPTDSRFGVSLTDTASAAIRSFKVVGPVALLGTFMIAYSLGMVALHEAFAGTGFFADIGTVVEIGIETTLGVPIIASMVLSARYVISLVDEPPADSWEEVVVLSAGASWVLLPPLLYVWPQTGVL